MSSKKHHQPTPEAIKLLAEARAEYHSPEATAARERMLFQHGLPKCPSIMSGVHEWTTIEKPFVGIRRTECRNCGMVP